MVVVPQNIEPLRTCVSGIHRETLMCPLLRQIQWFPDLGEGDSNIIIIDRRRGRGVEEKLNIVLPILSYAFEVQGKLILSITRFKIDVPVRPDKRGALEIVRVGGTVIAGNIQQRVISNICRSAYKPAVLVIVVKRTPSIVVNFTVFTVSDSPIFIFRRIFKITEIGDRGQGFEGLFAAPFAPFVVGKLSFQFPDIPAGCCQVGELEACIGCRQECFRIC